MSVNVAVLVSGSGTLLQAILDNQDGHYRVSLVAADKECPALDRARRAGIKTEVVPMQPDRAAWNAQLADAVAATEPDLVVSAGFMRILGAPFLARFAGKTINTHPSLLPAFPGADAVSDALAYGVKVTGCTVHYVDEGMDTGEIIAQQAISIEDGEKKDELHERIKQAERSQIVALLRTVKPAAENGKVTF